MPLFDEEKQRLINHKISNFAIEKIIAHNPNLDLILISEGNFILAEKGNLSNQISFTKTSNPLDQIQYKIDMSHFDNSQMLEAFKMDGTYFTSEPKVEKPTSIQIKTKAMGVIDEDSYHIDNQNIYAEHPVRFVDKNQNFRISYNASFQKENEHIEYSSDQVIQNSQKLFPTASMGKMFTAAMLIKTFEILEDEIDKDKDAKKAKEELLEKYQANTLMDVPLKEIQGLNVNLERPLQVIANIQGNEAHKRSITPAMLINHGAKIPEFFRWQNNNGEIVFDAWKKNPAPNINSILNDYHPTQVFLHQRHYSNGNTVIAGLVIENISGKSIQENLTEVHLPNAVILTSKDDLDNRDYARVSYLADQNNTGKPCDPGFTAGGYFANCRDVACFSQEYISGNLFTRQRYKDYMANSFASSSDTELVDGKRYQNSLSFEELDAEHHLRREQGFTHLAGHRGDTPNIMTSSKTPVKIDGNGQIAEIGPTFISMSVLDTTTLEKNQQRLQEKVQQKQYDTVNKTYKKITKSHSIVSSDNIPLIMAKKHKEVEKVISPYLDIACARPLSKGRGRSR